MFLKNYWYVAAWAHEVGRKPLGRILLNEPIVLFRKEDGAAVALENRCAHRQLQLSMGKVIGDQIRCHYHGLVYDDTGACTHIPGQKRVPSNMRVRNYPVEERHKFVWLWMGDPARADATRIPDFHLMDDPAWRYTGALANVACHYQLVIDNLLDLSHIAYVHSTTTGNEAVGEFAKIKTDRSTEPGKEYVRVQRWTYDVVPADTYVQFGTYQTHVDRWQIPVFTPPCYFYINNGSAIAGTGASEKNPEGGQGRWGFRVYHAITPETERTTNYFWAVLHDFGIDDPSVYEEFHRQVHQVIGEDIEVFENQQRNLDLNPAASFTEIPADAGLIQARHMIDSLLEQEQKS